MAGYPSVFLRSCAGLCLAEMGDLLEAISIAEEASLIAETIGQPYSLGIAYGYLGEIYLRKGDLPDAIRVHEHGLSLCNKWNLPGVLPAVASGLGYAYALSGLPRALPLLEQAIQEAARMRRSCGQSKRLAWLSEAYRMAGRTSEAAELQERSLALARSMAREETKHGYSTSSERMLPALARRRPRQPKSTTARPWR
jgi:tetratricopeptide (TPR) repeat protein